MPAASAMDNLTPRTPCIVSAVRTPLGAFQGSLSTFTAPQLGGIAIRAAVARAGIKPEDVQEVIMGNVLSANLGQAPATQAALAAGLPPSVPCTLVNKVCASGMKAVMIAAMSIASGQHDILVAGGMESMSNVPHYLPNSRRGTRLGDITAVDGLVRDGLWDPHNDMHMGSCAELCADKYNISRVEQDAHALMTHKRATEAAAAGWSAAEVVPVQLPGGKVITEDELLAKMNPAKLQSLQPVFKKDGSGTVTAGNASPMTDGAAALVVASWEACQHLGLEVLAVVRGFADANQAPEWFTTTPALAVPRALSRAGVTSQDIDYWEINQAFSVVDVVNRKLLGLPEDRVNAHGGAVALGHPIGCSGARILVTLINVLKTQGGRLGCAAICNGGGGASALVLEVDPQQSSKPRL